MKFKKNDQVIVTIGKDKGKKGKILKTLPDKNKVVVEGLNLYTKHVKAMPIINKPGEKTVLSRPLDVAKIAILNDKNEPDRIGYKIDKQGNKVRIFKKTGKEIDPTTKTTKSTKKTKKKSTKKTKKSSKK